MKLRFLLLRIILLLFAAQVTGCLPTIQLPVPVSPTKSIMPSSGSMTPSSTVVSPPPTSTAGVDSHMLLQQKCVSVKSVPITLPKGVLVLQDGLDNVTLLSLSTGQSIPQGRIFPIIAVSLDAQKLAYTEETTHKLTIINSRGEQLRTVSVPSNWSGVIQWVTDESLLINNFDHVPFREASTVLYNITTSNHNELLRSDYPNLETFVDAPLWENYSYTFTVYDPTLSRVVYPSTDIHGNKHTVLWDINNRQILLQLDDIPDPGAPQWFRDGTDFIIGIYPEVVDYSGVVTKNITDFLPYQGGFDLFRISRDGKIKRLTYLTTEYSASEEMFSISPDQEHVAFWLNLDFKGRDPNANRELSILNLNTREITNLCIPGGDTPIQPVWSPDGKYIVVTAWEKGDSYVTLIDLAQGIAMEIAHDQTAVGWLVEE